MAWGGNGGREEEDEEEEEEEGECNGVCVCMWMKIMWSDSVCIGNRTNKHTHPHTHTHTHTHTINTMLISADGHSTRNPIITPQNHATMEHAHPE